MGASPLQWPASDRSCVVLQAYVGRSLPADSHALVLLVLEKIKAVYAWGEGCDGGMALREGAQGCSQGLLQDSVPRMALTTYIHYHAVWKHGSKQIVSANN